ncbi:MAG TPA: ABC transporter permease [Natronosporangium sp.]
MSAADLPVAQPVRWALRPELRLLRSELLLIFGRRRNWAGLAVLAAVPILLATVVRLSGGPAAGEGPNFLSSVVDNGYYVPLAALAISLPLFLPLAVAAISGDAIAGEANVGTLRYLLAVPVHRTRLLIVKYLAVMIFAVAAVGLIAVVGLVLGVALFGIGPVTLLGGEQIGVGEGLLRLVAICGYTAAGLAAIGAIGLFISTLTEQPIGAAITVLVVTMASFILDSIDQLSWLHAYLPTHWWLAFGDLLRQPIYLENVERGLLSAGAYIVIFWTAAWARFSNRDVTS